MCAQIRDTSRDFLIPVGVRGCAQIGDTSRDSSGGAGVCVFVVDTNGETKITPLVSGGEGPKCVGVFLTSSH